ncbi:hypothetical protein ACFYO2_26490 [Streptomyces sp. NPDC006602]|uniref:hypothetical protein n=1 Tax=Streptomyces sp. NPDC006602 TaxID=3364751 RepID=UPI003697DD2C
MRIRLVMVALAVVSILAGAVKAEAHTGHHTPHMSYRARVLAGTVTYRPCVVLRQTREGRTWFVDMVSDTYDDGKRRTVAQQISYVREGCREMTR